MRPRFPYGTSNRSPTINSLIRSSQTQWRFPVFIQNICCVWISPKQNIDGFITKSEKKNIASCKAVFPMLFFICTQLCSGVTNENFQNFQMFTFCGHINCTISQDVFLGKKEGEVINNEFCDLSAFKTCCLMEQGIP